MTYKQAYDKIIDAYFKDEIQPMNPKFCFCGTLCGNSDKWYTAFNGNSHLDSLHYTGRELFRMEEALLSFCSIQGTSEEMLFKGMSAALDVLKQIHISRGEVIDETPVFTKRQLV